MDQLKEQLLQQLKDFKGDLSDENDVVYGFALELIIERLLAFCNLTIEEWPIGLNNTVVLMAIDSLDTLTISMDNGSKSDDSNVTQIKEGDFTIVRESRATTLSKLNAMNNNAIPSKYLPIVMRFRRLSR